jgi:hypothetical protein
MVTSAGSRRADLEVLNIRVAQQTDLLVDVIMRHDFIGAGRDGCINLGKLRNPDRPDQILGGAAAVKIRNFRNPDRLNRQVAFLPACMSTSGRIRCEFLRLLFFLANSRPTTISWTSDINRTNKSSVTGAASFGCGRPARLHLNNA